MKVKVIGAGLAGCEAVWQLVKQGIDVDLYEMKPVKYSPAHSNENFAELVCSNSLKADRIENACGLLKEEMRMFDSVMMEAADISRVPAGGALAVDRDVFAKHITEKIKNHPRVTVFNEEVTEINPDEYTIIATGPLTSDGLADEIKKITGSDELYFYDAAAPIVTEESIDKDKVFKAARYDKGTADYINCPMTKEEYTAFYNELITAETAPLKEFENLAENIKNELANAKEQLEIAEKRNTERIECELNLNVYTEKCNQTGEKIEEITAKINDLKTVINGDENKITALEKMISCKNKSEAEKVLDDLENRIDEMQKSFEIAEQNYNECVKVIDNAKAVINENEPLAKTENERIKKQEEKLEKAMQKYGIDDENTLEILVSDIENISDMRDEIKEYDDKLSACNERIKMLKENIGKAEKTDIEKLKADKEETENSLEEVTEQKNSLTANISINKRIMDETQKLKTELDESEKRYSTYLNISQTANGELSKRQKIAFEQYIQSAYFRSILNEANKRFSYMTNGRFELVKHDGDSNLKSHSGLDIDVFDNYTGKQRSVKSLSGGESFKASLCMALGLSEVIQRNAGGVKLESMFVDEGFGVLDNESLEQAIEVLNSLSESDRMVGIISHISELKDRIDKKIVVKKGSAGSTVELIN